MKRLSLYPLIFSFLLLATPSRVAADAIEFKVGGTNDPASIQATVDAFRAALGNPNNANLLGPIAGGRREINWDGGGAAALATDFPIPMTTFNSGGTTRGGVFTTPGTGFQISGQPMPEFGNINPTYPTTFGTFSSPRLFAPLGSNIVDVLFFIPGTNIPAAVAGFGAVFTDVDLLGSATMQYFDFNNKLLGTFTVPVGTVADESLSFLGVLFDDGQLASRVRIVAGTNPLGPNDSPANKVDVVALDDFLYSEPRVIPEPSAFVLAGLGILGLLGYGCYYRRRII